MFEFDNDLVTGVDIVDSQHRAIFEMVNEFYYAVCHDKGYQALRGMLEFLKIYVGSHFADEEKLMNEIGYEKYTEHSKQHADLTAQLNIYLEFTELDDDLLHNITRTLVDWLNCHIKNEDKQFAMQYCTFKK